MRDGCLGYPGPSTVTSRPLDSIIIAPMTGNPHNPTILILLFNNIFFIVEHSISEDCSAKCSFHGHCDKHKSCVCDTGWTGSHCSFQTCIAECVNGYCDNTTRLCVCDSGFTGKKTPGLYPVNLCHIVNCTVLLVMSVL